MTKSTLIPYYITEASPVRLRKLLIKNPYLPTFYENIRKKAPLNDSIPFLDEEDPLVDFILGQLHAHDLLTRLDNGYEVKYSRLVPPTNWPEVECSQYAEGILTYTRDIVIKSPRKKNTIRFGHYSGSLSESDHSSMIDQMVAVIDSFNDKPDGPIKYQTTFVSKQL